MAFNLSKTVMVLLLCLIFVGQAMASTVMSCHMMSMESVNGQAQAHVMSTMAHSAHSMVNNSTSDELEKSTEDCCEKNCNCFTGGCSSIAMLNKNLNTNLVIEFPTKITSVASLTTSQRLTSLYRPPIIS